MLFTGADSTFLKREDGVVKEKLRYTYGPGFFSEAVGGRPFNNTQEHCLFRKGGSKSVGIFEILMSKWAR